MSKTDKTRPYWVKVTERPMVTCVPVHNHDGRECDLPEDPKTDFGNFRRSCYWTWSTEFACSGQARCGCRMCTDHDGRRADRRKSRHQARTNARAAVRDWRDDYDAWVS